MCSTYNICYYTISKGPFSNSLIKLVTHSENSLDKNCRNFSRQIVLPLTNYKYFLHVNFYSSFDDLLKSQSYQNRNFDDMRSLLV